LIISAVATLRLTGMEIFWFVPEILGSVLYVLG
jgi:hypothetical protein